jgi:hypothetical protein
MERQSRLVRPHACVPPPVLVTMRQSRSKTAGHSVFHVTDSLVATNGSPRFFWDFAENLSS